MGKVGVILSKAEGGVGMSPTLSSGGQVGLMMNMSPENVNYAKFGAGKDKEGNPYGGSARQEASARRWGGLGAKARYGLGALSAFNRFYDATASGRPGALSAAGQGAMSGYYGSQGLENWAAERGAAHGARQERRDEKVAVKEAADARQRQEGMANYGQGAAAPHTSKGGEGMARDYAHGPYSPVAEPTFDPSMFSSENMQPADTSPQYPPALQRRIDNTKNSPEAVALREQRAADRVASANQTLGGGPNFGTLGNLGGSGSPNIFSPNYSNTQRHAGMMESLRTPVADPTAGTGMPQEFSDSLQSAGFTGEHQPSPAGPQATLHDYTGGNNNKVAVLDAAKLKEMESDGVDEKGNIVRGRSEVQ